VRPFDRVCESAVESQSTSPNTGGVKVRLATPRTHLIVRDVDLFDHFDDPGSADFLRGNRLDVRAAPEIEQVASWDSGQGTMRVSFMRAQKSFSTQRRRPGTRPGDQSLAALDFPAMNDLTDSEWMQILAFWWNGKIQRRT
jgi:hypothetical protein